VKALSSSPCTAKKERKKIFLSSLNITSNKKGIKEKAKLKKQRSWVWWLTPVNLGTWEAEIGRITV
jgi:hypothetical protein